MDLEASTFDLSDLVRDILISFELRIDEKELKMSLIFDKNIPPLLIGDPIRISQILINLIKNSSFQNNMSSGWFFLLTYPLPYIYYSKHPKNKVINQQTAICPKK